MGESSSCQGPSHNFGNLPFRSETQATMSEEHFDEFEHYNFDQDKAMRSGHSGKQRTKKEASMNTNKHNPGAREEDRDKVDERREEQLEQGGATRGGQLE